MSIQLELPAELEAELETEAAQRGLSLSDYLVNLLSSQRDRTVMPKTGVELVEYWQREGIVNARPDILDSQLHARMIREQAENRESR